MLTIKLWEITLKNIFIIVLYDDLLNRAHKAQVLRKRSIDWTRIKLRTSIHQKTQRVKGNPQSRKNIFGKQTLSARLVPRIYEEFLQSTRKG